jgi:uncharacterized protein (DUF488 family)
LDEYYDAGMSHIIVSVGYEGRTPDGLIALLLERNVERVIDVRELPLSRRRGFSKTALAERLKIAGIEYRHLRIAGNPHRQHKADVEKCLAMYDRHLRSHPEVIDAVRSEVDGRRVALLCFEREHTSCHRSLLLRALRRRRDQRGTKVVQIE